MSKPMLSLRRGQCRFAITPHSALSHLFCAEPVEHEKSSYCAHHAEICFDRRSAEQRWADHARMENARAARNIDTIRLQKPPARILPSVGVRTVYEEQA